MTIRAGRIKYLLVINVAKNMKLFLQRSILHKGCAKFLEFLSEYLLAFVPGRSFIRRFY